MKDPQGENREKSGENGISRRDFVGGTGVALAAAGATPLKAQQVSQQTGNNEPETDVPQTRISLTINGTRHELEVEDRWTLAELLRDRFGLTGPKLGCNRGECGACTVIVDDQNVYSCSTLAVWADGASVRTVEGLEDQGQPSGLQQAFIENNAPQCGYCTSGQLMSATALLEKNQNPSKQQVREALAGNLCRCSNYNAIVEAVLDAASKGAA